MATIYLTLTLKGQKDNIFSFYDERQPQSLNSLNRSSNNDDIESEISGANFYYEEGEESESYDETKNETADSGEDYESEESFESIEEIIKFKKTKTNHIVTNDEIVEQPKQLSEKNKKIESKVAFIDEKKNSDTPSNILLIKSTDTSNNSKTVTTNKNLSPTIKKTNTKKVNKKKTRASKKKKTSIKKPVKVTKKPVKPRKTAFVVKKPQKQLVKQKTKLTRVVPVKKFKSVNLKYIESAFDEEGDYDEDEIIATDTVSAEIIKSVESDKPAEPEIFSSNPCSGRSSRYIARCRKR